MFQAPLGSVLFGILAGLIFGLIAIFILNAVN